MEDKADNFIENGEHIVVIRSSQWNAGFRGKGKTYDEARKKAEFAKQALTKSWEENQ